MPARGLESGGGFARGGILRVASLVWLGAVGVLVLACTNAIGSQSPVGTARGTPADTPIVSLAGGPGGVSGMITAGPICAIEQSSPDPKCAPRPVAGAIVVAKDAIGDEVARTTSQPDGSYRLPIGLLGPVTISALPVAGLANVPAPVVTTFPSQMDWEQLNFQYDTGIR